MKAVICGKCGYLLPYMHTWYVFYVFKMHFRCLNSMLKSFLKACYLIALIFEQLQLIKLKVYIKETSFYNKYTTFTRSKNFKSILLGAHSRRIPNNFQLKRHLQLSAEQNNVNVITRAVTNSVILLPNKCCYLYFSVIVACLPVVLEKWRNFLIFINLLTCYFI